MTLANIMTAHAALSLGVFLISLAMTFAVARLDHSATLCALFSVGMALVWPVLLAVTALVIGLFACVAALYVPAGIIASLRGKPLIVTKRGAGE